MYQNIISCANHLGIRKQDGQSFCDFTKLRGYLNGLEENGGCEKVFDLLFKNVLSPGYEIAYEQDLMSQWNIHYRAWVSLTNKRDPKGFIACFASVVRKQICDKFSTKQRRAQEIDKDGKIVRNINCKHREYDPKYCRKIFTKKLEIRKKIQYTLSE